MAVWSSMISLLFLTSIGFWCSSHAFTFYLGGGDGWTLKLAKNYTHWAEKNRFQVHDSIVFKYKNGEDSVLVVSKDDYNKCNKDNPIQTFKDGNNSRFMFDRSGPFFFISGHEQNCEKGQKFIIIVLSEHHHHTVNGAPSRSPLLSPLTSVIHLPSLSPHHRVSVPPIARSPSKSPLPAPYNTILTPHPSPSSSPIAKTPSHAPQPSFNSSSPLSPHNAPTDSPTTHHSRSKSQSPSPSPSHAEGQSPKHNDNNDNAVHANTPPPKSNILAFPPHHAPAPAPSAASDMPVSFILQFVGFSLLVSTITCAGLL